MIMMMMLMARRGGEKGQHTTSRRLLPMRPSHSTLSPCDVAKVTLIVSDLWRRTSGAGVRVMGKGGRRFQHTSTLYVDEVLVLQERGTTKCHGADLCTSMNKYKHVYRWCPLLQCYTPSGRFQSTARVVSVSSLNEMKLYYGFTYFVAEEKDGNVGSAFFT